jgi:hypothetical protein
VARHVSDLNGPSSGAFTSCMLQIWYVVICVLLDTSKSYAVVGRNSSNSSTGKIFQNLGTGCRTHPVSFSGYRSFCTGLQLDHLSPYTAEVNDKCSCTCMAGGRTVLHLPFCTAVRTSSLAVSHLVVSRTVRCRLSLLCAGQRYDDSPLSACLLLSQFIGVDNLSVVL